MGVHEQDAYTLERELDEHRDPRLSLIGLKSHESPGSSVAGQWQAVVPVSVKLDDPSTS